MGCFANGQKPASQGEGVIHQIDHYGSGGNHHIHQEYPTKSPSVACLARRVWLVLPNHWDPSGPGLLILLFGSCYNCIVYTFGIHPLWFQMYQSLIGEPFAWVDRCGAWKLQAKLLRCLEHSSLDVFLMPSPERCSPKEPNPKRYLVVQCYLTILYFFGAVFLYYCHLGFLEIML